MKNSYLVIFLTLIGIVLLLVLGVGAVALVLVVSSNSNELRDRTAYALLALAGMGVMTIYRVLKTLAPAATVQFPKNSSLNTRQSVSNERKRAACKQAAQV